MLLLNTIELYELCKKKVLAMNSSFLVCPPQTAYGVKHMFACEV